MKPSIRATVFAISASLALSFSANAHRAWLLPSSTVLSGDDAYVTFDAAISNTIFHPDHFPMSVDNLVTSAPNGDNVDVEHVSRGKYRTTFDLHLKQEGTYKLASASSGLRAFWRDDSGNRKMWPGRGQPFVAEQFDSAVPKNANELRVVQTSRRVETFVTLGAPSTDNFAPTNIGLELVAITHPNDLFAQETARFSLLIDGEVAAGADIEVVRGGMRYRNDQQLMQMKSDDKGQFSITWPEAGMYFVEISYQDGNATAPATIRSGSYSATFEVLPL
jgi:uncharacterized GH25 family protein